MDAPKRIILEDTGERRYPKWNEFYAYTGPHDDEPAGPFDNVSRNDDSDPEWAGDPADYAIYRIVEAA
jgi:hypothetical protein